jgi:NADH-quinone oxidoreductase subunit L
MGALAVGAVIAGFLQIPYVTEALHHFLEPTFAGSEYFEELHPSDGVTIVGLIIGTVLSLGGIALAHLIWVRRPGTSEAIRLRLKPLYGLFVNKWFFDEIIDWLFVRPARRLGGVAQSVVERLVIDGGVTGGANGAVRAGSAAVRAIQTGLLRYYVALIVIGMVVLTAYFLLQT